MKKIIINILLIVCLCVLAFSGYKLYEIWQRDHTIKQETAALQQYLTAPESSSSSEEESESSEQAEQSEESRPQPEAFSVDWDALLQQNSEIRGWIIIPGTGISYPIVQGTDNSYYLDHTAMGAPNRAGAIFMDANVNPDFTSDNSLIYGHSVDIGGMFTNLKFFEDQAFFDSHPYFWILSPSQNYKCNVFAFSEASTSSTVYTIDFGDYEDSVLESINNEAMYTRDAGSLKGKPLVSLSTCNLDYGYDSQQRLVLSAVLEPYNDPIPVSETE